MLTEGEKARDEGILKLKMSHERWMQTAVLYALHLPAGWTGTGEDMRLYLTNEKGMPPPDHPNAWGALMRQILKTGRFQTTGKWIKPRDVKSHARPTREYIKS